LSFKKKLKDSIIGIADTIAYELSDEQEKNIIKGIEFESVVGNLFPEKYYTIVKNPPQKTPDTDGRYIESNLRPDYKIRHKKSKEEFWVECKFKTKACYKDKKTGRWTISVLTKNQFKRFKELGKNKDEKIFVIIGEYGYYSYPKNMFILDLDIIDSPDMFYSKIKPFKRKNPKSDFYYDYNKKTLS
jgi:hypothetical protein